MELIKEKQSIQLKYPVDWGMLNLGKSSVLKARIGWQGLTTAEYLDAGDYYLITGTDFKNGYIDWDNCVYVEKLRFDQDKNIQVKENDVLVTKDGTIGKVAFVNNVQKNTTLNSGVYVIRPLHKSYYPRYFYYVLMSEHFKDFLGKLAAGSTISHLYQKDFVHYEFPLPPTLTEQKAIATALSDIDALIASLEQTLTKKKAIKQGAMQQLLTPPNKGGKRLPGFSGEWVEKKLGDVFSFKQGLQCAIDEQFETEKNNRVRFIRIIDLTNNNEPPRYISKPDFSHIIKKDDLFMVRYGTPGLLGFGYCGVIANNLFRLLPKVNLTTQFFYHLLKYKNQDILNLSSSTTMAAISFRPLTQMTLNSPNDVKEQQAIAQILSDMDAEITQLEAKKEKYQAIKQGMMQELLTGKTRLI
jgi:type I restriction enzyme S subunit